MRTLYDLLGALPHDDSEALRAAFRRAVKGAHPDLRPGDPDAALKFREIVRANEILGDAEQRAAYDDLLELARMEHEPQHAIAARIHRVASGVIAITGASVVMTVGGYLLFMHMSVASVAAVDKAEFALRASPAIAMVIPAASADTLDKDAPPAKRAAIPDEAKAPADAMPRTAAENLAATSAGPAAALAASEARFVRTPAISNERDGDPNAAFVGLASHDPIFLPAYIDGGIIFYRSRKFDRAFADVTPVKQIEKKGHARSVAATARKPHFEQAAIVPSVPPLFRQRTAEQDPSRGESIPSLSLR